MAALRLERSREVTDVCVRDSSLEGGDERDWDTEGSADIVVKNPSMA